MRPAAAGSSNVESFTVCTIVNQRLLKAAPPQHDFRLLLQCGHQVARKPREQPLKSSQAKSWSRLWLSARAGFKRIHPICGTLARGKL